MRKGRCSDQVKKDKDEPGKETKKGWLDRWGELPECGVFWLLYARHHSKFFICITYLNFTLIP